MPGLSHSALPRRAPRRWRHTAALLALPLTLAAGCGPRTSTAGGVGTSTLSVILMVNNRSYFDVNIYALRSPGGAGRRLGTVSGGTNVTLRVPENELQPGGRLQVSVRAISGRTTWISQPISVSTRVIAQLDVVATNNGDLSQSQLYPRQGEGGSP